VALEVIGRARNLTLVRDSLWTPRRRQAIVTLHDQHYYDAGWVAVDEALAADGLDGFARRADRMRHALRLAENGTRRWYPRRDHPEEYVEFGRPQYWTGSEWQNITLGTPTYGDKTITWDRPAFALRLKHNWHQSKIEVVLKSASAARRLRWPVSLNNLRWEGWQLLSGETVVARVSKPFAYQGLTIGPGVPRFPVNASYGGGYVEFTADLSGATFPVTIDPTLTLDEGEAGADVDTFIYKPDTSTNYGSEATLEIGNIDGVGGQYARSLIKFDLSAIDDLDTVTSATLTLTLAYAGSSFASNNRAFGVYRVKRAWVENQATWNVYSTGNNWGTGGCENTTTDREADPIGTSATWTTADGVGTSRDTSLSGASKAALDLGNGWLLQMATENGDYYLFASSDHGTAAYRPKLVVVYTEAGGGTTYYSTPSGTLTTAGALGKQHNDSVAGALTSAGALQRQANKALAGALSSSGVVGKDVSHTLRGALSTAGSVIVAPVAGASATILIRASSALTWLRSALVRMSSERRTMGP